MLFNISIVSRSRDLEVHIMNLSSSYVFNCVFLLNLEELSRTQGECCSSFFNSTNTRDLICLMKN